MLNKLNANQPSFQGTLVKNQLLNETLEYSRRNALEEYNPNYNRTEVIADSINYMLNNTPDSDVFELTLENDNVKLLRNGKSVAESRAESYYNGRPGIYKAGISTLSHYVWNGMAKPRNTKTKEDMQNINLKKIEVSDNYWSKKRELDQDYAIKMQELDDDKNEQLKRLNKEYEGLEIKRAQEAVSYLNQLVK